jgi:phospholipid/cholesterol/gamma-HCH transport system substrate-binding protein
MKVSRYIKLGLLMAFSITALVWGLSYLKGHDFFKPVSYYYTRYQKVDGLQESSHYRERIPDWKCKKNCIRR